MSTLPLPLPALRALNKFGEDISKARRRRRMSQIALAERLGVSERSVRRMEQGDPNTAVHTIVRALHVFGELERFSHLLGSSEDVIGLALMDEQLPKRIRARKSAAGPAAL
jgi:transcriptional regulator with XRE-family HTH domain